MFQNPEDLMNGRADEFRVSEGLHSAGWIATEYQNQKAPAAYWLAETSVAGTVIWYGPALLEAAVAGFILEQNHPNPCDGATSIRFSAASGGDVVLRIVDVRGREVRRLLARAVDPGAHQVAWDGRDGRGRRVQPGLYFYTLETPRGVFTRKLVVM
jgi:hypothetical protein